MSQYQYIDDLFVEFYKGCLKNGLTLHNNEQAAANFMQLLTNDLPLTKAQSLFVIQILKSHKDYLDMLDIDIDLISELKFKNKFRIKDNSKWVDVEYQQKEIWIIVKQPFENKDKFEKTCLRTKNINGRNAIWDPDKKIKKYKLDIIINCILLKDFCLKNSYQMSESFINLVDHVELIWNNQNKYLKKSVVIGDEVKLINASESAQNYFDSKKINKITDDLLLAKFLGHSFDVLVKRNFIEKVCSSPNRFFWTKEISKIVEICELIEGKICFLINKEQTDKWLHQLVEVFNKHNIPKNKIKIGFRSGSQEKPEFNKWIKENNHGGKMDEGKILIFKEKPPKWLISDREFVKIYISTSTFIPSSALIQSWFLNQSCVIFFGDIKPTLIGEKVVDDL